jgi:hypothetical protein
MRVDEDGDRRTRLEAVELVWVLGIVPSASLPLVVERDSAAHASATTDAMGAQDKVRGGRGATWAKRRVGSRKTAFALPDERGAVSE